MYKVRYYHIPLNEEAQKAVVRNFRKWMLDHKKPCGPAFRSAVLVPITCALKLRLRHMTPRAQRPRGVSRLPGRLNDL